jgi:hypothetical protein
VPALSVTAGVIEVNPEHPAPSSLQVMKPCVGSHVVETMIFVSKLACGGGGGGGDGVGSGNIRRQSASAAWG